MVSVYSAIRVLDSDVYSAVDDAKLSAELRITDGVNVVEYTNSLWLAADSIVDVMDEELLAACPVRRVDAPKSDVPNDDRPSFNMSAVIVLSSN